MKNACSSSVLYFILITLGYIAGYYEKSSYALVFLFFIFALLIQPFYQANTKNIELKDGIFALLFLLIICFFSSFLSLNLDFDRCCLFYCTNFISCVNVGAIQRFKTLI